MEEASSLLTLLSSQLGLDRKVNLRIKKYRKWAASANLRTATITIDEDLANSYEVAKYLILHELIHIKLDTKYHSDEFYRLLYSIMEEDEVKAAMEEAVSIKRGKIRMH
ncbi:YgjP-like metallopeptidase domain-containing protein [Metallosphaera javensis (ex Hofmann et al. 2022)]|uniref:YgjP-like metallopeptidase domain-containing protein n=1 Tax=Metallosphaera javensis (ex Hofmann et al. 2022) TaxID=99938 RepID=UPI001EDF21C3|nr:YgjP-like metallopeptidase domain-containing protein [Metallosphaera javensis (ex Hofmann et al. 2022)]